MLYGTFANWFGILIAAIFNARKILNIAAQGKEGSIIAEAFINFSLVTLSIAMIIVRAAALIGLKRNFKINWKRLMTDKTKITIEANINAPVGKVWNCYTQPEHITKWNFASDDWHCPSAENDLRVGGKLNARMEAKDGSNGFDFEAIYTEIIPHKKIAYRMLDDRNAVINFNVSENQTEVIITFEAEYIYPIEMQKSGWQAILNNFKEYVEIN